MKVQPQTFESVEDIHFYIKPESYDNAIKNLAHDVVKECSTLVSVLSKTALYQGQDPIKDLHFELSQLKNLALAYAGLVTLSNARLVMNGKGDRQVKEGSWFVKRWFENIDDLPSAMQDRENVWIALRKFLTYAIDDIHSLSHDIASQAIHDSGHSIYRWSKFAGLLNTFTTLVEYSRAKTLVETELRIIHDAESDRPF